MAPIVVDDEAKLHTLLDLIKERTQADKDQLIFADLEGVDLGRSGTIAIMQLLLPPSPVVYLVDVHLLRAKAFDLTTADGTTSLRSVLESRDTFKVFFDIRNDSDALHAHFGINVAGIIDLQVIEFATRNVSGDYVNGLARCIERDLPCIPGWAFTKLMGRRLFAPEAGGRYEVFLERPMAAEILAYCEQDVTIMPRLLAVYGRKLEIREAAQLQGVVDERIRLSKSKTFNGKGQHMAIGPHLVPFIYLDTTVEASREIQLLCSDRLAELCRLDDDCVDELATQFDTVQITDSEAAASTLPDTNTSAVAKSVKVKPDANEGAGGDDNDDDDNDSDLEWISDTEEDMGHDNGPELDYTACPGEEYWY